MKLNILCIATALAQAFAWASDDWDHDHFTTWSPPGPGDGMFR